MNINNWNKLKTFKDNINNYEIIKVKPKNNTWIFHNGITTIQDDSATSNNFKFVFKIKYIPTNHIFYESWTDKNKVIEQVKELFNKPKGYKTDYIFKVAQ